MPEGDYTLIILIVALGAMFWWMSRRTRAQQKAAAQFRDHLTAGQEVMTGSGFFGTISAVDGDRITLESAGTRTVWLRQAIAKVVEDDSVAEDAVADDAVDGSASTPDDRDQPHA